MQQPRGEACGDALMQILDKAVVMQRSGDEAQDWIIRGKKKGMAVARRDQ